MAKQIQLRRGSTTEHTTFVGAVGEVTVDTTKDVVVVHDGITSGGVPGARQIDITAANAAIATLTANVGLLRVDVNSLDPGGAAAAQSQLRANITAANVKIANLESNAVVQATQINTLTSDLGGANSAITSVQISLGITNATVAQLQAADTVVNAAIISVNTFAYSNAAIQSAAIDELRANVTAANAAILVNTNRVTAANSEIGNLRANISAANSAIGVNTNRVAAANVEISNLRANITAANVQITNLFSNASDQSTAIATINSNVSAANSAISTNTNRVAAANVEISNLRANITAANAAIVTANSYGTSYTDSQITAVRGGVDGSLDTLFKLANAIANDASYSSNVTSSLNSIRANVTSANAAILVNTNRVAAANAAILLLQDGIDAANTRVAAANVLNSITNSNVTAANAQITNIRNVIASNGNVYTSHAIVGNLVLNNASFYFANGTPFVANTSSWIYVHESPDNNSAYNIPYIGSDVNATELSDSYKQLYSDTNTLTFNPGTNLLTAPNISTSSNTQAVSTTTGALRVIGGASIALGNLYIGGSAGRSITATGNAVITGDLSNNPTSGALVVSGGVGVTGNIIATGNIISLSSHITQIAAGNTVLRPADPAVGMIRYNTTLQSYEGYGAGNAWSSLGGVKSVSGNAYISAELSAGSGDDVLRFYSGSSGPSTQVAYMSASNTGIILTTAATSTSTGALQISGGVGIAGNLHTGGNVILASNSNSNVVIVSNTVSETTTTGALVVHGGVGVEGVIIAGGNIVAANGASSTNVATGSIVTKGGVGILLNLNVGGLVSANSGLPATSTTSGALRVAGGAGIQGNLHLGGVLTLSNSSTAATTTSGALVVDGGVAVGNILQVGGNTVISSGTASANTTTGALVVTGGIGVSGNINAGGGIQIAGNILSTAGQIHVATGTESTSTTTGALRVTGGAGVSGRLNVGGNIVAAANTTSVSTTTGALVVAGGVGIAGNLVVGGNLSVGGTSFSRFITGMEMVNTVDSTSNFYVKFASIPAGAMSVNDVSEVVISCLVTGRYVPAVETYRIFARAVGSGATAAQPQLYVESLFNNQEKASFDASDFILTYETSTYAYELYYRFNDANQRLFVKFDLTTSEDTFYTGNHWQLETDAPSNTFVGLGTTVFGVLMGKTVSNLTVNYAATITTANASTSSTTGALVVSGGVGIGGRLNVGGNIIAASGTASTDTSTGALIVSGGAAVTGVLNVGGNIVATAVTSSISPTTGAMVVRGGLGVVGNVYSANVYINNRLGFTYSGNNTVAVYQVYNQSTNSIDTIFGAL